MGAHKTFILVTGLFTLSILLTGFWVRSNGKPYSPTIWTIHKLISLAAAVVLGSAIIDMVELRLHTEALTDCRVGGEETCVVAGFAEAACEAGVISGIGDLERPAAVNLRREPRQDADD